MAQRWRGDENRSYGGNQRPAYWDQNEGGRNERGQHWQGQDYRDRDRSFEQFDSGGGRGQQGSGQQGSGQQAGGQDWQQDDRDRDYGGARFARGMERDFNDMGAGDRGASGMGGARSSQDWGGNYGGGSQSGSGWRGNQSAFYGEEGGGQDSGRMGRDAPFSHGGMGHRQQWGQGGGMGGGQGGYEPRGYEAQRDWQGGGQYRRHFEGGGHEQGGSRWGQFGGPDEETQGPRSQRGMGRWREQYGSGEEYGRGGGPSGQMDYGQGYYGRDQRGGYERGGSQFGGGWYGEQQSHRGKGPKGYERSPERLKEDLCERLSDADDVDASEISISVKDGIVTLEGTVPERQMKYRAEDIVERCQGVKDVENRLKVQGALGQNRPSGQEGQQAGGQQAPGQQGTSNQNRLTGGGSLRH